MGNPSKLKYTLLFESHGLQVSSIDRTLLPQKFPPLSRFLPFHQFRTYTQISEIYLTYLIYKQARCGSILWHCVTNVSNYFDKQNLTSCCVTGLHLLFMDNWQLSDKARVVCTANLSHRENQEDEGMRR